MQINTKSYELISKLLLPNIASITQMRTSVLGIGPRPHRGYSYKNENDEEEEEEEEEGKGDFKEQGK